MTRPRVSVVMPVYNAARFVAAAVESVLAQTFSDFEFIVIDDDSTDESLSVVRRCRDPRLHIVSRPHQGVVATMNAALELCRGDLVARADADDLNVRERLDRQVAFFDCHPEVVALGGAIREGDRVLRYPEDALRLRWLALYQSPFANPTLMFQEKAAAAAGGYPADHEVLDDYPFMSRLLAHGEGANLPDVLVVKRANPESITERHRPRQVAEGDRVRRANLAAVVDCDDIEPLFALLTGDPAIGRRPLAEIVSRLERLLADFRRRWAIDEARWREVAPWIARQLVERALHHGQAAPSALVAMVRVAVRLDRRLMRSPALAKGLLRHLVLPRLGW